MPRHRHHRRDHGGVGNGNGHERSGGYHRKNDMCPIRCSHCAVLQPASCFPKSVLQRYMKRVARGDEPSTINVICRPCCDNPVKTVPATGSSSAAGPSHPRVRALANVAPPSQLQRRGCCTGCGIEYPLTPTYFSQLGLANTQEAAATRVCYPCRNKQTLSGAAADMASDDPAFEDDDDDENIHVDLSDENSDSEQRTPTRRIEDLDDATQQRARRAQAQSRDITTLRGFAHVLAARRRRSVRFVPSRVLIRQRNEQHARETRARLNRDGRQGQVARQFTLRTVHRIGHPELPVPPTDQNPLAVCDDNDTAVAVHQAVARYRNRSRMQDNIDQKYRDSNNNGDDDDDDSDLDVVPSWYLSDRQRVEHIQRQREIERDLERSHIGAPQDDFSRQDPIIDEDLVRHFDQRFSVARASPAAAPAPSSGTQDASCESFRMIRMLRALDEESRQHPFKRLRDGRP
ncbi:related to PSR1-plasma membrane phosphatase required for sodium stress response [Sporisorium scitamineum]|uniref:Related to PSR1-plasma membrane phosphatase required for sodium stress response n=1 Tax=Sporisorium scitamineum TaxID=49012 RepID=A0A0F7SDZ2_9BASI|nr:related to PSR1-plasma membrane phosphatase required for sodium stress response [Sporisorium scitamineum]CDW99678.1 hypothetical protein [Sporisorium scitamineum]